MNDQQFQLLVKMIEALDKKIDTNDLKLEKKIDDFKAENQRQFTGIDKQFGSIDKRFESIDKRFESIDKRFENMDKRFENIDKKFENTERLIVEVKTELKEEIREVKHDVRQDRDKLQEVYESRDRVTVNFTRSWSTASFFIALITATIVLAVVKAF